MRLLLDSSVLLAAVYSRTGASRLLIEQARRAGHRLIVTPYIVNEVERRLSGKPADLPIWRACRSSCVLAADVFRINPIVVFDVEKDRPVLFAAYTWADMLITLDRRDFVDRLGQSFYHVSIRRPGPFLQEQRDDGLWID